VARCDGAWVQTFESFQSHLLPLAQLAIRIFGRFFWMKVLAENSGCFILSLLFTFSSGARAGVLGTWGESETVGESQIRLNVTREPLQENDFIVLKSESGSVVGLFEVANGHSRVLNLLGLSHSRLPQRSDTFFKVDLPNENEDLVGSTALWRYRGLSKNLKSLYKPLYTQGATIGDTAQTLYEGEFFASAIGTVAYGVHRRVTMSSNLPAYALGSPNFRVKGQIYSGTQQTWAMGVSYAESQKTTENLVNIDLMWDSVLSENLIAHSILSAAVVSFDEARDIAALKSYGNSSLQTGYEYLFSDWSRMIIGPNYNIEQKAIGGYVGYLRIFDKFHLQVSLSTTNVREVKFTTGDGYLAFIDAYWRW